MQRAALARSRRCSRSGSGWYEYGVVRFCKNAPVTLLSHAKHLCPAGFYFPDVAHRLVKKGFMASQRYYKALIVDKCDSTVLQLTRGIRLRVYIAPLPSPLRLEAHGIVEGCARIGHVVAAAFVPVEPLSAAAHVYGSLAPLWQCANPLHELVITLGARPPQALREPDTQHREHGHLGRISLRRGDGDLRSCPCVQHVIRKLCNCAVHHVDYRDAPRPQRRAFFKGRDGIRRLTGPGILPPRGYAHRL